MNYFQFVKKYASEHNMTYQKALMDTKCKNAYKNLDKVNCVMCDKSIQRIDSFAPRVCLNEHSSANAHRICKKCWFNKFAIVGQNHKCPGCATHKPLNKNKNNRQKQSNIEVIDITDS